MANEIAEDRRFWPPDSRLRRLTTEHPRISTWKQNPWATFLLLAIWVYPLSNFCGKLRKTQHLFIKVQYNRSRSSKVVDFGSNQQNMCELVINSSTSPILRRYW